MVSKKATARLRRSGCTRRRRRRPAPRRGRSKPACAGPPPQRGAAPSARGWRRCCCGGCPMASCRRATRRVRPTVPLRARPVRGREKGEGGEGDPTQLNWRRRRWPRHSIVRHPLVSSASQPRARLAVCGRRRGRLHRHHVGTRVGVHLVTAAHLRADRNGAAPRVDAGGQRAAATQAFQRGV